MVNKAAFPSLRKRQQYNNVSNVLDPYPINETDEIDYTVRQLNKVIFNYINKSKNCVLNCRKNYYHAHVFLSHIIQYTDNPHCPGDKDTCTCSKTGFDTSWCCTPPCYNITNPLPPGPLSINGVPVCPNNCIVYCDRSSTVASVMD